MPEALEACARQRQRSAELIQCRLELAVIIQTQPQSDGGLRILRLLIPENTRIAKYIPSAVICGSGAALEVKHVVCAGFGGGSSVLKVEYVVCAGIYEG